MRQCPMKVKPCGEMQAGVPATEQLKPLRQAVRKETDVKPCGEMQAGVPATEQPKPLRQPVRKETDVTEKLNEKPEDCGNMTGVKPEDNHKNKVGESNIEPHLQLDKGKPEKEKKEKGKVAVVSVESVKFSCSICNICFNDSKSLENHRRRETLLCNICHKSCHTRSNLYAHLKKHSDSHMSPSNVCNICSKCFVNRSDLYAHLTFHSEGLRTFSNANVCNICSKSFNNRSILYAHLKKHSMS